MFFFYQRYFNQFDLLNDARFSIHDTDFTVTVRTGSQYVGMKLVNLLFGKQRPLMPLMPGLSTDSAVALLFLLVGFGPCNVIRRRTFAGIGGIL
jgi:hypothetical protein